MQKDFETEIRSATKVFASLQIAQNDLLRTMENVKIKDKVSIKSMLNNQQMLSVNQLQAQIKLTEMWKAAMFDNYPLKIEKMKESVEGRISEMYPKKTSKNQKTLNTFIVDATRLWNKAPNAIRNAKSIKMAKKEIKLHCKFFTI